jgi:hypothetical protein
LLDTASRYEVHKYIAVAHKLMAQISVAAGDTAAGESEFMAVLEQLQKYPVPVVTWRTYAELGRLKTNLGDVSAARDAFGRAAEIVNSIATNVADVSLRETFLTSDAVREVMAGALRP